MDTSGGDTAGGDGSNNNMDSYLNYCDDDDEDDDEDEDEYINSNREDIILASVIRRCVSSLSCDVLCSFDSYCYVLSLIREEYAALIALWSFFQVRESLYICIYLLQYHRAFIRLLNNWPSNVVL